MSDYFGTKQTRVIDVDGRSLDNVVLLTSRPPLTSEWNLINQISNEKVQDTARLVTPSGWTRVGNVSSTISESDAQSGDVLTSVSYDPDTFKLISKNGCVAVVNGWRLLVQGWNSPDDNNIVELDVAGGQRYDFVFLEVWRKLVAYNESLYPYGNVSKTPYTDNEILWPAVGTETSMRVQVQYRIRSESISSVLAGNSDVFSDVAIHPIGGRAGGEYTFNNFVRCDPDDVGLYRAGDGSEDSQSNLATVDGYVYAIPMFVVSRRIPSSSVFSPTTINSGYTTASRATDGYVTDRPDGRVIDRVYAEDVVDFRHQIVTNTSDVKDIVDRTVSRLVAGTLTTALKMGFDEDGQQSSAVSGGSLLTKAERINSTGMDNIPNMGTGDEFRRAFCNASMTNDHCVIEIDFNGSGQWVAGTISMSTIISKSYGSVGSVEGVYSTDLGALVTDVAFSTSSVIIGSGSNLIGQSCNLYLEFSFEYDSSDSGFKDVPRTMLEASKGSFTPISLGSEVPVRFNNTGALLNFSQPIIYGDSTPEDYVFCKGGNYTENYNFGHDLVVYRTMLGATVNIALTSGVLNGYYILGVKRVRVKSGLTYGNPVLFTVTRTVTVGPPYVINNYIVTPTASAGSDVEITLITGSKVPDDVGSAYDLAGSMKFFEVNRQGRGVVDTYEMIDVVATEDSPGEYTVDTTTIGKPIIAIGTKTFTSGSFEVGEPIAFKHSDGTFVPITTASPNASLPVLSESAYDVDWLPTRIVLTSSTVGASKIRVPVLVHAAPTASETPYTLFYSMAPYQGILSATTSYKGKVVAEDTSFVTSLGSGAIINYLYEEGTASFQQGSRTVTGSSTEWSLYAKAGDFIAALPSRLFYRIREVTDDDTIVLAEPFSESDEPSSAYNIVRYDSPLFGISNVVDRLPSYYVSDSTSTYAVDNLCISEGLVNALYASPLLNVSPVTKMHDPMASVANDFIVGDQTKTNIRGRYDFRLSGSGSPAFRLSDTPRAHIAYPELLTPTAGRHKVYQFYLFARSSVVPGTKEVTGRLYLMVVSGESCTGIVSRLSTYTDRDTVDLFELVGRPVVRAP